LVLQLRYGMNPHQSPASVEPIGTAPVTLVHGHPSYLNVLDAISAWQLVQDVAASAGIVAAASFKHLSPAGAALAGPIDAVTADLFSVHSRADAVTRAYARARDTDPKSSYGDMVAVSAPVTAELADLLRRVVSDGIIAPGYEPGAIAVLSAKKRGTYLVLEADATFEPPHDETRELYGLRFVQRRDDAPLPHGLPGDLRLALTVVRYTQSNSVALVRDGATLGVGAGQQSRVDCIRLAGTKARLWHQRRFVPRGDDSGFASVQDRISTHLRLAETMDPPVPLERVSMASDGALSFEDNIAEAAQFGVRYIAEPGGSTRSNAVAETARRHGINVTHTGLRLFRH
jgi:phosphoribosylaminoimidazolecarboxamide formyltransferase/IMP cyclohydrolase